MLGGVNVKKSLYPLNNFNDKPLYHLNNFNEKTMNIPYIDIKNMKLINNNNYTDADSLVEYFHGMLLNYISLEKSKGKLSDDFIRLEKVIKDYNKEKRMNKIIRIKGGGEWFKGEKYKEDYDSDTLIHNDDDIIKDDGNKINIIYNSYVKYKGETALNITIEYIKEEESNDNSVIRNRLVLDFMTGNIYETENKVYKKVYVSSKIIDKLIKILIKKLTILFVNKINVYMNYGDQYDEVQDMLERLKIYQTVTSLLIIILSFRNNMDKDTFTKYNYSRFISDFYMYYLKQTFYKFDNNNMNVLLTYNAYGNHIFNMFSGDCALNALTCVKYKELHKLLVTKKNIMKHKELYDYNNVNYYDRIKSILLCMDKDNFNEHNNDILDYVQGYTEFIKDIYEYKNLTDYNELKNNYDNRNKIITLLERCMKYDSAIRSNLIDYNAIKELEENIIKYNDENTNKNINSLIEYFKSETIKDDLEEKIKQIDNIFKIYYDIIKKYNANIFYINILLSLYLIYYKVDYLFDEKIFKFYSHINKRKYAINRFRNISFNSYDIDLIRYSYYKDDHHNYYENNYNDDNEYFFSFIDDLEHATLLILEVNPKDLSKTSYVCDLNNLNFLTFDANIDPNDTKKMDFESIIKDMGNGNDIPYILMLNFGNNIPYTFNFGPLRYSSYHYDLTLKKYMEDCENSNSAVPCMDVQQLVHTNKHYANFMQVNIMKNNNILQYLNKCLRNNNIQGDYEIPYRLLILYINNNNDYEIYKKLGGNGHMELWMHKVRELKVI